MTSQPLPELTAQSAGVGMWTLLIADEPQTIDYTWKTRQGESREGKRMDVVLVSEDCTHYCQGVYKKIGAEPKATATFHDAVKKYKKGTIWNVSKISLTKDNPKYLGCSCKVAIDMNTSRFQPVLQSTVKMPMQAAPPENLSDLLECPGGQLVDVLVLVKAVSEPSQKTTTYGERNLVEITIMDDSGKDGPASCVFKAWFPTPKAANPCPHLEKLKDALENHKPIAFFNLVCHREAATASASEHSVEQKTTLKTSIDKFRFQLCDVGVKAERLKSNANNLLSTEAERVTVRDRHESRMRASFRMIILSSHG